MQVGINISSTLKLAEAVIFLLLPLVDYPLLERLRNYLRFMMKASWCYLGKALYEGNICLKKVIETLNRKFDTKC